MAWSGCRRLGLRLLLTVACVPAWSEPPAATGAEPFVAPSSDPQSLTVAGGKVYFCADDGAHGRELWESDGQPGHAKMVTDFFEGRGSSNPMGLKAWRDQVMFSIGGPFPGRELAILSAANPNLPITRLTTYPGNGSNPIILGPCSRWMYITADVPGCGHEVCRSDGTVEGTVLVKDLRPGGDSCSPGYENSSRVAIVGDDLYFLAFWRNVGGKETAEPGLWKTNGTEAGTVCVGAVFEQSEWLTAFRGRLYFNSSDPEHGRELWCSDGTPKGTHMVADINPGSGDSSPSELHPFGDLMLFQATDPEHGKELWRTDGTQEGTLLLGDLNPGVGRSDPYGFMTCDDRVFFTASSAGQGRELWVTDGTESGTHLVKDIFQGTRESSPYQLCAVNGTLFFSAGDDVHGEELWRSDGTESGTTLVKDISPGPTSSEPYHLVNLGGTLIFTASEPVHGRELWRSDGTEAGTLLTDDIYHEPFVNPSSSPTHLTPADGRLYFVVNDIEHGAELWKLEHDRSLPQLVRDIYPGPASSSPDCLASVGKLVFFRADDGTHGPELWRSDGTEGGTTLVHDVGRGLEGSGPREITAGDGGVFFVATEPGTGTELWWGDAQDAHLVTDIAAGPASSSPHELVYTEGLLFFAADDGVHGEELWRFDASRPDVGARLVMDIVPAPFQGAAIQELGAGTGGVYFSANDGVRGRGLWFSDGTLSGTQSYSVESSGRPSLGVAPPLSPERKGK